MLNMMSGHVMLAGYISEPMISLYCDFSDGDSNLADTCGASGERSMDGSSGVLTGHVFWASKRVAIFLMNASWLREIVWFA